MVIPNLHVAECHSTAWSARLHGSKCIMLSFAFACIMISILMGLIGNG